MLSLLDLLRRMDAGELTPAAAIRMAHEAIAAGDPSIEAFVYVDAAARACPEGPLRGIAVGVKDIVDTADFPTENGSVLCSGRRPLHDAAIVARLRAAGAVLLGKTVTTEFACFAPGKTRNPHDPARTPGGSSSGSAAAVAASMVPLAIGSQTNGSVIRPASFCGVYGLKPSYGLIPRTGVLTTSATLDHVGVFARDIDGLALIAETLIGFDASDPATRPLPPPPLRRVAGEPPPVQPRLAFVQGPAWEEAEPATREAFAELAELLGPAMVAIELPAAFAEAVAVHRTIWTAELAFHLADEHRHGRERLSDRLRQLIEAGQATSAPEYQRALAMRRSYRQALEELFQHVDAVVTPAAPGEAPRGLESTGSPAFCTLWSLTGSPAVSLPIMQGPNGLPLGCQLVGGMGDDARLLRTARWLVERTAG
jgi:Asp-tRNA(Asn)/Glu-tRNA(Gln) amidotransferase A subunit family amidase